MKLTIKHLAPYLPYGLIIQGELAHAKLVADFSEDFDANETRISYVLGRQLKPILRPLSDLTKEIGIESVYRGLIPWDEMSNEFGLYGSNMNSSKGILRASIEDYQKLFQWHFDVFGLIPEGLAIDVNTIEQ